MHPSFREAIVPPKLRELRQKLGRKAKEPKRYRFYSLYALVNRPDTLQAAWVAVLRVSISKANGKPRTWGTSAVRTCRMQMSASA